MQTVASRLPEMNFCRSAHDSGKGKTLLIRGLSDNDASRAITHFVCRHHGGISPTGYRDVLR